MWNITPKIVLNTIGCPCHKKKHSTIALIWLEQEAKKRRIKIQHAGNGGEFAIPNTRFRADGYHTRSNTIFEFYGDIFHGNLSMFKPNSYPHPFLKGLTAKQLNAKTIKREKLLESLGYKVVSIWENDFRNQLKLGLNYIP